jgi:hypothetical protein
LSKLSKPPKNKVGVFTDVGRFLTFCEEPPVMVLKNKSELFQFAEIKRKLECDYRYGSYGGKRNKFSIPAMVPVLL